MKLKGQSVCISKDGRCIQSLFQLLIISKIRFFFRHWRPFTTNWYKWKTCVPILLHENIKSCRRHRIVHNMISSWPLLSQAIPVAAVHMYIYCIEASARGWVCTGSVVGWYCMTDVPWVCVLYGCCNGSLADKKELRMPLAWVMLLCNFIGIIQFSSWVTGSNIPGNWH